jgi:hypothetical protein
LTDCLRYVVAVVKAPLKDPSHDASGRK